MTGTAQPNERNQLKKLLVFRAGGTFVLRALGRVTALAVALVLARLLGTEGFGAYSNALAWVMILAIPSQLGLGRLLVREVARGTLSSNWDQLRGLIIVSNTAVILASILIAAGAVSVTYTLEGHGDPQMLRALRMGMLLLPIFCMLTIKRSILEGLRHVVAGQIPEMLIFPMMTLILTGVMYVLLPANRFDAFVALQVTLAAAAMALVVGWLMTRAMLPRPTGATIAQYRTRAWLAAGLLIMLLGGARIVSTRIDIVMLGMMQGAEDVGVYTVASRGAGLVLFVVLAMNAAIRPEIARLYVLKEHARLQRIITHTVRVVSLCALPIALVLMLFGPWFLLLFGDDFLRGHAALVILCGGEIVSIAVGSVSMILVMTGFEREVLIVFLGGVVLNIVLNLLLISNFGMEGAAAATAASIVMRNVFLCIIIRHRLRLDSTVIGWPRFQGI